MWFFWLLGALVVIVILVVPSPRRSYEQRQKVDPNTGMMIKHQNHPEDEEQ